MRLRMSIELHTNNTVSASVPHTVGFVVYVSHKRAFLFRTHDLSPNGETVCKNKEKMAKRCI